MRYHHGELVLLGEMAQLCVVGGVADVEDYEGAGSPLLDCEKLGVGYCRVESVAGVIILKQSYCAWDEVLGAILGFLPA